jgi:hypothetical protein
MRAWTVRNSPQQLAGRCSSRHIPGAVDCRERLIYDPTTARHVLTALVCGVNAEALR